ncbi:hypothetical protein OSB04_022852 [Centaurea solstitialis]|uniref:Glutamate receptor n=1 Tax=Centaurea solstitialis TaxID=347529 RepID=A0AA38SVG8_9ASTR|nr:hypothetical protein OSB04_022852 [Centaurea solstitialis]
MFTVKKTLKNHRVASLAMMMMLVAIGAENGTREVEVGVILDMDSYIGMSSRVCISMALEDFYDDHNESTTIIRPHYRDSENNDVQAASVAIDLMKNTQVMAILGPQQSSQANFILDIAKKSKIPIISSSATNPNLIPNANNFFIRTSHTSSTQAQPIAAIIKSFGWTEIVLVYEDSDFGKGLIPYLSDAMESINSTPIKHFVLLPPSSSDDLIVKQLHDLKTMQTRVFVVHMLPNLGSRFFKKADEVGMMARGKCMHGVIGVKPYIPPSKKLTNFNKRWRRRFQKEYPEMDRVFELDLFGIWWYDSVFALATSLEKVNKTELSTKFKRPTKGSTTDLASIGTSEVGEVLFSVIRNIRLKGMLSGDFEVVNGQLRIQAYEIVNVIGKEEKQIGFWNSKNGISRQSRYNESMDYTTNKDDLGAIIWPGDTIEIPKGWEIPTRNDRKLRVGVPAKGGFVEFIEAEKDPNTNITKAKGFCIDVFKAVLESLPYDIDYKFIAFEDPDDAQSVGDYNDLVQQIFLKNFDMVVGDVTIRWNRSLYVDFTTPYSESGVSMIVPVKAADKKNAWIFMRPLEKELWITTAVFFVYTGFVVWALEHRVNKEFRGPRNQQIGMIFWFSFSTLVFSHKEKMISNLSRFVVIVWVFVVLVLTSSYTASLSSMLTLQSLEPTVSSIQELIERGDYVGYQDGSFVKGMLMEMGFPEAKLKKYANFTEYANALSSGSKHNGVSAIVDEIPYLKMFQAKNYNKYSMVGRTNKTEGFGFAFPKGSPMVADFSKAILKLIEGDGMRNISNTWIGDELQSSKKSSDQVEPFKKLKLDSFIGLFVIAGLSSTCALVVFLFTFMYENKEVLTSQGSLYQKLAAIIRSFDEDKSHKPSKDSATETVDDSHMSVEDHTIDNTPPPTSPSISVDHQAEGSISPGSVPIQ